MITAMIVDDEAPARNELRYILEQIGGVTICAEAANGTAALTLLHEHKPDLLFLDILMPGLSGLDVQRLMLQLDHPPIMIFATAFDHYAVDAFEINAFDYVLKPFVEDRLRITIAKVEKHLALLSAQGAGHPETEKRAPKTAKILLYSQDKAIPVSPQHIVFAYRDDAFVKIKTSVGFLESKLSLNELESKLVKYGFLRTHRKYLVNLNCILEMIPWFNGCARLVMNDKERTRIEVSRLHAHLLKSRFL